MRTTLAISVTAIELDSSMCNLKMSEKTQEKFNRGLNEYKKIALKINETLEYEMKRTDEELSDSYQAIITLPGNKMLTEQEDRRSSSNVEGNESHEEARIPIPIPT